MLTRHFVEVNGRAVHYRRAGRGSPLLLVHRSPHSSFELEPLIERWAEHFTCIAPDTPGFGQSDPLQGEPEIGDYADALVAFMDAIGLQQAAVYGVHSGGMIAINALHHNAHRFTAVASIGYALMTDSEAIAFQGRYLPPLVPSAYGEHLTWLWNRILEQSWFFPWFDAETGFRLPIAHDDALLVAKGVADMLDAGDNYRIGYSAVLRAPHLMPAAPGVPVLVAANMGDPLQPHLSRLTDPPAGWRVESVATTVKLEQMCLEHLQTSHRLAEPEVADSDDRGFCRVVTEYFDGLIHWSGDRRSRTLILHGPGRSVALLKGEEGIAIDLPGHGLSNDWSNTPAAIQDWINVVKAALAALDLHPDLILGEGMSAILAAAAACRLETAQWGGIAAHLPLLTDRDRWNVLALPDVTPDRHGAYLAAAWNMARAEKFFWPWFDATAANAIPIDVDAVRPEAIAAAHLSFMRARSGRKLLSMLLHLDWNAIAADAPALARWDRAGWSAARTDMWSPRRALHIMK